MIELQCEHSKNAIEKDAPCGAMGVCKHSGYFFVLV